MENATQQIAIRLPPELHEKIVEHQKAAEKLTGFRPSLSDVVRKMIEEAPSPTKRKR